MRKERILLIIILCVNIFLASFVSRAEENNPEDYFKKNNIFYELAGYSRSLFSVNYERLILKDKPFFYTLRIGIGYTPGLTIMGKKARGTTSAPIVLTSYFGKKNHYVSLGVGYTASFGENNIDSTINPPQIYKAYESAFIIKAGYRYINISGLTGDIYPLLQWTNNPSNKFSIGFGLSLGYSW